MIALPSNAELSMRTELAQLSNTFVKLPHPSKARYSMLVTLAGMDMLVIPDSRKAQKPIRVHCEPLSNDTLDKLPHP